MNSRKAFLTAPQNPAVLVVEAGRLNREKAEKPEISLLISGVPACMLC